jgi:N-acetylmuramoyl-L-alanine amidase
MMKKVVLMFVSALVCGVIFTSFGSSKVEAKEVEAAGEIREVSKTIVIDAGHGGRDPGAVFDGKRESDIVKNIALKIYQLNRHDHIKIVLLRDTDEFVGLADRVTRVNEIQPDFLISLHTLSSRDTTLSGINAFISQGNSFYNQSRDIAQILLEAVSSENLAKGTISAANLHLIKEVECPAVMLEIGFLSNIADRNFISSEIGQTEIATKILDAIK